MRVIKKIIKIIEYIPILWRDEDWDYEYLLDLIVFKLKRMQKCIARNAVVTPNTIREISIGINQTIDHIENFCDKSCDRFESIYGESPIKITFGQKLTEEEDEIYTEYIMKHYNFENSEWNAIWDTIKEEGRKWWD